MIRKEYHLYCMREVDSERAAEMQLTLLDAFKNDMVDVVPNGRRVIVNIYGSGQSSVDTVNDALRDFNCEVLY